MLAKTSYIIPLFLFSFYLISGNPLTPPVYLQEHANTYRKQAREWIEQYICDKENNLLICPHDLHQIYNLAYFSYARSCTTLMAQQDALVLLNSLWQAWQNIAQTRRNPSRPVPYPDVIKPDTKLYDEFCCSAEQHAQCGKAYATLAEQLVNTNVLQTVRAQQAIATMRSQSRLVVANALLNIQTCISQLKTCMHELPQKTQPSEKKSLIKKRGLLSYMKRVIPECAQNSFVSVDKLAERTSETLWDLINTIQQLGINNWQNIECARGAFYYAYYDELSQLYRHLTIGDEYRQLYDPTSV